MGSCIRVNQSHSYFDYTNINIDQLLNKWTSTDIEIIKNKMNHICSKNNKKKMEINEFLEFFPNLQKYYKTITHKRLFNFFDHDKDGMIQCRQLQISLTIILRLDISKLLQLLFNIYKQDQKKENLSFEQFDNFIKQNDFLFSNKQQLVKMHIKEYNSIDFLNLIEPIFNLQLFHSIFDCTLNQKEAQLLQQLRKMNFVINIKKGQTVYILQYKWFQSWKKYVENQYFLEKQIQIIDQIQYSKKKRYTVALDNIFLKLPGHQYQQRPNSIQNYRLEAQFQWQIKQNLQIYQDFVVVPQFIWKVLKQVYGGGPQFRRIYPQFHPVLLNRVFVDEQGKFVQNSIKKYFIQYKQKINKIFNEEERNQNKFCFYKKNIGQVIWNNIHINQCISDLQIYNQCFICLVPKQIQNLFLLKYNFVKQNSNLNKINYGQVITIKNGTEVQQGYVMEIQKQTVKIHLKNKTYQTQKIFSFNQFQKLCNQSVIIQKRAANICIGLQNYGNSCYINSIIQCLFITPILDQLLLNQNKIESFAPQNKMILIKQSSKLAKQMKKNKGSLNPVGLKKAIKSVLKNFANNDQQDAQQFLIEFLNKISEQMTNNKAKIEKLKDLKSVASLTEKYCIINNIFEGIESRKINCMKCKNEIEKQEGFFSLNIPVPEIQWHYYSIIYYPSTYLNNKKFKALQKFTIKVKKSNTFKQYALLFAQLLKKQLSSLYFCEIIFNEFRKPFQRCDYQTTLLDLYLRQTDTIIVYQKQAQISELKKIFLKKSKENQQSQRFPNNLKKGNYLDFLYFNQWEIAKFIQNVDSTKVKLQILQGESVVDISKIAPFTSKTYSKSFTIIVINRTFNIQKQKIEYPCFPFIVTVFIWMKWKHVVQKINNQAQRFLESKTLDQSISHTNKKQESNKKTQLISSIQTQFKDSDKHKQTKIYPFKINILNLNNQKCYFCNKIVIIDPNKKQNNHCKGCTIKQQNLISLMLDLRNVMFCLDWNSVSDLKLNSMQIEHDISHTNLMQEKNNQKNTLNQCFQLYSKTQQIQFNCGRCQHKYSYMRTYISKAPNILIIRFKRFKFVKGYLEKMENKIVFLQSLEISSISMGKFDQYELYAINCHRGSGTGGHYYSYILKDKKLWVKCDDQITTLVDTASIDLSQIYLLFYRRRNIDPCLISLI